MNKDGATFYWNNFDFVFIIVSYTGLRSNTVRWEIVA